MAKERRYPELNKIKGRIREKGQNYEEISEKMGMRIHTFSNKVNGWAVFTIEEVVELADILEIEPDEIPIYFFPQLLRNAKKEKKGV